MPTPELLLMPSERVLVGFQGTPADLLAALQLCRRFAGTVIFRQHDVLVLDISVDPELIDDLLARLGQHAVTHVWRSGLATTPGSARPTPNFCDN